MISVPLIAYAVSQYDSDGFTIFPGKSSSYISGYRQGVVTAHEDIKVKMNTTGIDAHQEHIVCPANLAQIADMCPGYKDGYADEAMDELE